MLRHIHAGKRRNPLSASSGCSGCSHVASLACDETMYTIGVRPVAFNRNGGEAFLLDQTARDSSALPVEVMGSVRCFADQYESRVARWLRASGSYSAALRRREAVRCGRSQRARWLVLNTRPIAPPRLWDDEERLKRCREELSRPSRARSCGPRPLPDRAPCPRAPSWCGRCHLHRGRWRCRRWLSR